VNVSLALEDSPAQLARLLPRLTSLHFEQFKGLGDLTLSVHSPLTVLIGANGAGKTSILQGAELLGKLPQSHQPNSFDEVARGMGGAAELHSLAYQGTSGFALTVSWKSESLKAGFQFRTGRAHVDVTMTTLDGSRGFSSWPTPSSPDFFVDPKLNRFRARLLRLEPSRLGQTSPAPRGPETLTESGSNLAAVLSQILSSNRPGFGAIEELLRKVVPSVRSVNVPPGVFVERPSTEASGIVIPRETAGVSVEVVFEVGDHRLAVPARHISEGTLLTLAILAAIHGPQRPRLLLIDDIDRGLHPRAQAELIHCLRLLLAAQEDLQVICTTHSPYLLDQFEEHEVAVIQRGTGGAVIAKRLSNHPDWERMKGLMGTGEFWGTVGEEWVFHGSEP
jgi:ABC-type branched-subunit amino acid transport system ATPase component